MNAYQFGNWNVSRDRIRHDADPYRPLDFERQVYLPDWDSESGEART